MLEMAKWPFCVNPNPDLQKLAEEKDWPVYRPVSVAGIPCGISVRPELKRPHPAE